MADEYIYCGKPLSAYSSWDLIVIDRSLKDAELRREEASKHPKFNVDSEANNKKVPKMQFPPPNPEFLKLKIAIEEEIRKRENV
jgi:hypothetical protein